MLEKYKETFDRITIIEHEFANGCREHPNAISAIMLELAGHYTFLNNQKVELEVEKFKKSIVIRDDIYNEAKTIGGKVTKTQLEQNVDDSLADIVSSIMILEGKLVNIDKLISVCQSSLKSIDREKRMPY
jgi:hypothetical protein